MLVLFYTTVCEECERIESGAWYDGYALMWASHGENVDGRTVYSVYRYDDETKQSLVDMCRKTWKPGDISLFKIMSPAPLIYSKIDSNDVSDVLYTLTTKRKNARHIGPGAYIVYATLEESL